MAHVLGEHLVAAEHDSPFLTHLNHFGRLISERFMQLLLGVTILGYSWGNIMGKFEDGLS